MSSGGGDAGCCAAAGTPPQVEEQEEEDFYDCQEDLAPPEAGEKQHGRTGSDGRGDSSEQTEQEGEQEEAQSRGLREEQEEDLVSPEAGDGEHSRTVPDRRTECCDEAGEREDEEVHTLQEEKDQQEAQDSDSELKAEVGPGVEFDDDYLREAEKDLTEEEKESRRQESLTLKEAGNGLFKAGDWAEAERSYTAALTVCPVCFSKERSILFSNRAAARGHLDLKDSAISDCSRAIDLNPDYLRALLRRAELYEQTEKLDEALEDYKKVLERDPSHAGARQACMRLPQQIQERNEKLKEEMMSKLKDLGNMILRPFGLSTNNFQVNQDSASGSYSINFVQNPNNNNR